MVSINIIKLNGNKVSANDSFDDADTASNSNYSISPRGEESQLTQKQIDMSRLEELLLTDEILTEKDYQDWMEIRERRKAEQAAW